MPLGLTRSHTHIVREEIQRNYIDEKIEKEKRREDWDARDSGWPDFIIIRRTVNTPF
jgi:hypothetical protein